MIFRKTLRILFSIFILQTILFVLIKCLPGGPFDSETTLDPLILEKLKYISDQSQPFYLQYLFFIKNMFTGQWGTSLFNSDSEVIQLILLTFKNTLVLNILSLLFILFMATFLSWLLVVTKNHKIFYFLKNIILLGLSFPTLLVAILLFYLFSFKWEIFPMAFLNSPLSYVLPILSLSFRPIFQLTQFMHSAWEQTLHEKFIQYAKAKGLSHQHILFFHALKYSLVPILAWLPNLFLGLFSGSLLVENIFSIQGLGSLFVESLSERDYPLLFGQTFFMGALVILVSSLSELTREYLDPRLKENFT